MIQAYCLSVIYLIVSALLFLVDSYRRALSPVILLKGLLIERRSALRIFMIAGLLIALFIILFPVSPGPVILGDFIPAFWIIYSAFFFHINYSAKSSEDEKAPTEIVSTKRMRTLGMITSAIAVIHFAFPSIVLL